MKVTGAYTQITEITAPSSAIAGDTVYIVARVKNLGTYAFYIAVTAVYDSSDIPITPSYQSIAPGAIGVYNGYFTMPNNKVRVYVWSYYWTGSAWYLDDQAYVDIALAVSKPVVSAFQIADYAKV